MRNLRNGIIVVLMALFSITNYAQSPSDVDGEYTLGERNTVVKIEKQNEVYSGKIISSDNPKAKIGKLIIKDLKLKKGKWRGKIYAPKRKEWYDAEFTPKENSLEITIKVGFMSKTINWKRK
jgi:uncharacterized protein (DUF2147 family)